MQGASSDRIVRRLAAILAADVAGYSRLMGQDEEGTHERLKTHLGQLVEPKIKEHRGRTVKNTGDGFLSEFASVVDAVRCAVEIQRGMRDRERDVPDERRILFRIGINLGDVIAEEHDIFGDGVNVAARLEGLAEPGGICVSGTVHDHVRDKLDVVFEDMSEQRVKNIARPVHVWRVRHGGGPVASAPAPALALPDKPSIAVLPFQNMSGDPDQEYFADGMVEEIITALSKVRWFFVVARNSTFAYKSQAIDIKRVGRQLGVRYVLEGSVRRSANRIRITAQLIDATTGNHVWAERYDREIADIFTIQDEITERVVSSIEPELYAAEHYRSRRKPPESLDAWECVARALSCIGQGTVAANAQAEALCRRALTIEPNYGQAHSLLAWVLLRPPFGGSEIGTYLPEAFAEAVAALNLDQRDPWAHLVYGIALWRMRRNDEAEQAFHQAVDLNPNFALALAFLGSPLGARGAAEEAIKSAERALRLSPADGLIGAYASFAIGFAHFSTRRYADSIVWVRRIIEKQPENLMAHCLLIAAAAIEGEVEMAAEALTVLLRLHPNFSLAWASKSAPFGGKMLNRLLEGLRKAGVSEG
ncbi:MAG TPA: adenylate/guanylate cyclase domain-containing protein [Stellaceae bacterium]|nr:adenylate/guanylate cyclase domain-containing protein [Stellaceae bacterium]